MKHDSRNLKYGSTATAVSVILIAAIIILNAIFTSLTTKYGFYTDMTSKLTYTLTDEVKHVLSDVTSDVKIIFCHDRDYIEASSQLHDVMVTAENLAEYFPWLTVEYVNSVNEPLKVAKYKLNSSDPVYQSNVIVECGEEWRKLSAKAFYVVDSDGETVWGLQAEEKFASAILGVTAADLPIAYCTTTHGEALSLDLLEIVSNAGYELRDLDLMTQEIDPDARLIIINGPKYDFEAGDETGNKVSELEKIDKFLSQDYGSLMCFLDPYETNELKNLKQYLYEWGVVFDDNIIKDSTQAVSIDGNAIVAEYCTDDTLASNLIDEIASIGTRPKTIFDDAGTISIAPTFSESRDTDDQKTNGLGLPNGAYSNSSSGDSRDISPVFVTGEGALSFNKTGEGEGTAWGGKFLMTISRQIRIVDNEYFNSYVLCANTLCFNDPQWITSNVYANRDTVYAALKQFGRETVPSGIDFKEYANYDIEDMTTSDANTWTVLLIVVPALAFAITGTVICVRRKYK